MLRVSEPIDVLLDKLCKEGIFEVMVIDGETKYDYTDVFREYLLRFLRLHGTECKNDCDFFVKALKNYGVKSEDVENLTSCLIGRNEVLKKMEKTH